MKFPLVLDLAADGIPVAVACRVLGFSKQAFYAWKTNPVTERDWSDAHLINAAVDVHRDDPAFGYRFIAEELPREWHPGGREQGPALGQGLRHLVGVLQEAGPGPEVGATGPRRPGGAGLHCRGAE